MLPRASLDRRAPGRIPESSTHGPVEGTAGHNAQGALAFGHRMASIAESILAAGHELPYALLDATLRVLECNAKARHLFGMQEAGSCRSAMPRLLGLRCFPALKDAASLCLGGAPVDVMMQLPTPDPALVNARMGCLVPDAGQWRHGANSPVYVLLMGLPVPESAALACRTSGLFELSPAEARVLGHLLNGATATRIASETDTCLSTVRTHIQNVLSKTGVTRQVDLIRALCGLRR